MCEDDKLSQAEIDELLKDTVSPEAARRVQMDIDLPNIIDKG